MDPKVDMSQLATMMLEWERRQKWADALRAKIKATVMRVGETQTVGNVRATYSGGRKTYDYYAAAVLRPAVGNATIELFTVTPVPQTDWRAICEHAGVEKNDIPFTQSEPSVTIKLLK